MGALPGSENALTPGLQLSGRMEAADTAVHDVPLLLYWKTPPEGWCEKLKTK